MSSATNYCLKGPQDQIVGFRLDADELGHEIYDLLDWADEHFSSHSVQQTDARVYIYSETARETLSSDEIYAEPISIEDGERPGNGPSSGGPGGGSAGGGSAGNDPVTSDDGGGATAEPAGR